MTPEGQAAKEPALVRALRGHWPEYLMEAAGLGLFMLSACLFGTLLEHPGSPLRQAIAVPLLRRVLMGLAMGLTGIAIIYSPWGKRSGAHLNPSVTLTFWRRGKVPPEDAFFYITAQFVGAVAGVRIAAAALPMLLSDPAVDYVVTRPGEWGLAPAFLAELVISFAMMSVILRVTNHSRLAPFTGLFAGALVALYIVVEAPLSGMSMNPARTFGSAASAQYWPHLWLYFLAPPLGMMLASELYRLLRLPHRLGCAKLHHERGGRCIFCGRV
jgi:aquaporin Z